MFWSVALFNASSNIDYGIFDFWLHRIFDKIICRFPSLPSFRSYFLSFFRFYFLSYLVLTVVETIYKEGVTCLNLAFLPRTSRTFFQLILFTSTIECLIICNSCSVAVDRNQSNQLHWYRSNRVHSWGIVGHLIKKKQKKNRLAHVHFSRRLWSQSFQFFSTLHHKS